MFNYLAVKVYSVHKRVVPEGTLCIKFYGVNQLAMLSHAGLKDFVLRFGSFEAFNSSTICC